MQFDGHFSSQNPKRAGKQAEKSDLIPVRQRLNLGCGSLCPLWPAPTVAPPGVHVGPVPWPVYHVAPPHAL